MICIGHDDSITEETRNAWNGAQTCGFGPLDGNYAPSTHCCSWPVPGASRSGFDVSL